ncbi:hypothetical protein EDC04DRAFT_2606257 [Pisolithus marmoratus]|nr:hypothetical protein EDC04DRAFT_2606257 [Pisolithus marmoratus]
MTSLGDVTMMSLGDISVMSSDDITVMSLGDVSVTSSGDITAMSLGDVSAWKYGDPHAQVDIHLALYLTQGPADDEYVHLFNIHCMKHISLRALCHLHDNQWAMSAITLLSKRHQLRLDDEDHVNVMANANLVPCLTLHYLHYTLSSWS